MEKLLASKVSGYVQTEADWKADFEADTDAKSEGISWENYLEALEEWFMGDAIEELAKDAVEANGGGIYSLQDKKTGEEKILGLCRHEGDLERLLRTKSVSETEIVELWNSSRNLGGATLCLGYEELAERIPEIMDFLYRIPSSTLPRELVGVLLQFEKEDLCDALAYDLRAFNLKLQQAYNG